MPEKLTIRREISFAPRSTSSTVDVVPIGFELYSSFVTLEEHFFDYDSLTAALVLLCLTDTAVVEEYDEETPVQEIRPFLRAHYDSLKSQPSKPLVWSELEEDETDPTVRIEVFTDKEASFISDRIGLLERLVREVRGDDPPTWLVAFKADCDRRAPVYYYFDIVLGEDVYLHEFDWSTWKRGKSAIRKVKR